MHGLEHSGVSVDVFHAGLGVDSGPAPDCVRPPDPFWPPRGKASGWLAAAALLGGIAKVLSITSAVWAGQRLVTEWGVAFRRRSRCGALDFLSMDKLDHAVGGHRYWLP